MQLVPWIFFDSNFQLGRESERKLLQGNRHRRGTQSELLLDVDNISQPGTELRTAVVQGSSFLEGTE